MEVRQRLGGAGLFARAVRGSAIIALSYVAGQGLRLASNLILTRLLFPEAFGLMTLVTMVLVAVTMFSDMGLGPAIMSSQRGDDPRFLDTAWTIQVLRGGLLWLICVALAWPLAQFYQAPELAAILPVAAVSLLIGGVTYNRLETAGRHLLMGKVMGIDLAVQAAGIVVMVVLAALTGSVWALVWGNVVGALLRLGLVNFWLTGHRNRLAWDRAALAELVHYGGWIFLSTVAGFLLAQGDKAILGRVLGLEAFGVYNIGYFLASFPLLLTGAITGRVLIPLYREIAAVDATPARRRLRRLRFAMTGIVLAMLAVAALLGVPLVRLLYDPRYAGAGALVVAIACVQLPQLIVATYDQAALAAGDSRGFFIVTAWRAGVQTGLFLAGAAVAGLGGALIGQALAGVLAAPAVMWLARRHGVHDPRHDLIYALLSVLLALTALTLWQEELAALLA